MNVIGESGELMGGRGLRGEPSLLWDGYVVCG